MRLSVAIVGAGPSGFYAADALLRADPEVRIDLIERLPTPFGLVRAGVAPDHQSTKAVERAFDRTLKRDAVRYFGNVEIGRDLTMDELCALYDAVVLAVGAPVDRPLEVPGADKIGVLGSAAFVGWYNGHPDFHDLQPPLDTERVVVVGNGNVALDIARVLVKTPAEMASSDIDADAEGAIDASPIRDVVLLGRRGPAEAKFTPKELRELGELEEARPDIDAAVLEDLDESEDERAQRRAAKNLEILRGFAEEEESGGNGANGADGEGHPDKQIHFEFFARPLEVLGGNRVVGLHCMRTRLEDGRVVDSGVTFDIPCGLVISAIGYRTPRIPGVPFDARGGRLQNEGGRIAPGLYAVGWCKRGPVGVIGSNKHDGDAVAQAILADLSAAGRTPGGRAGRGGLEPLLSERGVLWVDYRAWQEIDRAERAAAPPGAPRRKFVSVEDMLSLLRAGGADHEGGEETGGTRAADALRDGADGEERLNPQQLRG